jgi:integrase
VPNMRLHDLRHQAATGMAYCGVPLDIRQMVQNQVTGRRQSIGAIYDQHDYEVEKRRALEVWERSLRTVVAGAAGVHERY